MDKYRAKEFKKVDTIYSEFRPKLKIIKPNGETNWLDITEKELQKIKFILTA